MPDTLPGFLIAAGLILFVFSLFEGAITIKNASLPSLGKKGRITLMILGPALIIVGGITYYYGGPVPMAPPPSNHANLSGSFDVPAVEEGYTWKAKVEQNSSCDFTAQGKWSFGAGIMVDAEGNGAENRPCSAYHDGNCPSKTSKLGVLVAKGGNGVFRPIGINGRLEVKKGDEIFFTINDVGSFADNFGKVTVKWQCYKI